MTLKLEKLKMANKNKIKGASFTYAFGRINEAIKREFYLEAVTLAESVISDRLYSFVKHHEAIPTNPSKLGVKEKKARKKTGFQELIRKAQKLSTTSVTTKSGDDMFAALDTWRDQRNQCVHSVAKSEPGEPTINVDEFVAMARVSAIEGKKLARLVCDWHRSAKQIN